MKWGRGENKLVEGLGKFARYLDIEGIWRGFAGGGGGGLVGRNIGIRGRAGRYSRLLFIIVCLPALNVF